MAARPRCRRPRPAPHRRGGDGSCDEMKMAGSDPGHFCFAALSLGMSSLRTQGPIATGFCCRRRRLPYRLIERPRGMGPCVRRDDNYHSTLVVAELENLRAIAAREQAHVRIEFELGAGVRDVEVAHG